MSEQPIYAILARSAKLLMGSSLHSERMAVEAFDYWHRQEFRARAKRQRKTAWEFLTAARSAKKKGQAGC